MGSDLEVHTVTKTQLLFKRVGKHSPKLLTSKHWRDREHVWVLEWKQAPLIVLQRSTNGVWTCQVCQSGTIFTMRLESITGIPDSRRGVRCLIFSAFRFRFWSSNLCENECFSGILHPPLSPYDKYFIWPRLYSFDILRLILQLLKKKPSARAWFKTNPADHEEAEVENDDFMRVFINGRKGQHLKKYFKT